MTVNGKFLFAVLLAFAALAADAGNYGAKKRPSRKEKTVETRPAKEKIDPSAGEVTVPAEAGSELPVPAANRALGVALFSDKALLWESSPVELAKRMKLPVPKRSADGESLGIFTKRKVFFAGSGVEEFRFFCRDGKVVRLDLMILDKGDSIKGKVVSSRRSDFSKQLQREERQLTRNLTAAFGSPGVGFIGSGKFARRCPRWFCREAAIAVEANDREFLVLHILPPEQLTKTRLQQSENRLDRAKLDLAKRVRREENGDVFLEGVPMVDQGSKGYCVPATLERCFRYYGINDFDMHRIADAGRTGAGESGGTVLASAISGLAPMLRDSRLRISSCGKLRLRSVARAIDAGTPVVWALFSSPEYLARLKEHNAAREKCETIADWKTELRKMRRLSSPKKGAHVCLIIGYNSATEEIAVTNSWGSAPLAVIAWVRIADALAADAGEDLYTIKPR